MGYPYFLLNSVITVDSHNSAVYKINGKYRVRNTHMKEIGAHKIENVLYDYLSYSHILQISFDIRMIDSKL